MKNIKVLIFCLLLPFASSGLAAGIKPYTGKLDNPQLSLRALDGKHYDLNNYKGQVVLVNFWATWCPPCIEELPSLKRLENAFKDQPFKILTVDVGEEPALIQSFLDRVETPDLTVLLDPDGKAHHDWKIYVFPTSFLLDRTGKIRYGIIGALPWDDEPVMITIKKLISE